MLLLIALLVLLLIGFFSRRSVRHVV
jgi:hypothetical protein